MKIKDACKLINELRPDVDISVMGVFGKGINDRAWFYSTVYGSKPPNFENTIIKDEEVSTIEVLKDAVYIGFDMNKGGKR